MPQWVYDFFQFKKNGADLKHEILAALTIYLSMVYVVFTIPTLLIRAFPGALDEHGAILYDAIVYGVPVSTLLSSLVIVTCLSAGFGTLLLAFYTRLPFAMAPSLSLCIFITYYLCIESSYTYFEALAAIFISGIVFLFVSLMGWRKIIIHAIPKNLRYSITAGLGFFLAFTGLQRAGIIMANQYTLIGLNSFRDFSDLYTRNAILTIAIIVLVVAMIKKNMPAPIMVGKLICIAVAIPLGLDKMKGTIPYGESFTITPLLFKMDFAGFIGPSLSSFPVFFDKFIMVILSITLIEIFESIGTLVGSGYKIDLLDKELHYNQLSKAMNADALATVGGSFIGTPAVSLYAESAVGVFENGKTGFTALIAGMLFLLTSFFAPYVNLIPPAATASTIIVIGAYMMNTLTLMKFEDFSDFIPCFFIMIMIPLTYSITTGIAFGLITHTLIYLLTGRYKEVHPILYVLSVMFCLYFVFLPW